MKKDLKKEVEETLKEILNSIPNHSTQSESILRRKITLLLEKIKPTDYYKEDTKLLLKDIKISAKNQYVNEVTISKRHFRAIIRKLKESFNYL